MRLAETPIPNDLNDPKRSQVTIFFIFQIHSPEAATHSERVCTLQSV